MRTNSGCQAVFLTPALILPDGLGTELHSGLVLSVAASSAASYGHHI